MKMATWNINSVRARADRAIGVLERWDLDVLLVQETKCKPEQFPVEPFEAAGYEVAAVGLNQWNGVAIVSRVGIDDVRTSFPGQPGFAKSGEPVVEARAIGARCGGLDLWSVYVPNGRALGDPHYAYKLEFLDRLATVSGEWLAADPESQIMLAGDWNVAPLDSDVWDMAAFSDDIYVTDAERTAFNSFARSGFEEVTREADGADYTFWDYQRLRFPKNEGMRIDFAWASPALARRVRGAHIDRDERKGKGASDHVPVIVEID
ncbi:endonuclease/exonuclease/phosphatase family protein [Arcanobacterium haemolyticum]|nr:endonuclease/exonuclease/phosphatase family protein [Arcanobacterium haemolyticum]